ncbi:MAG: methionine adenosyltransferase [bacterium]|nr:methionine adenosyltransferase [bacterium]
MRYLFTSESVTEGHPDKICDQISDAILDDILAHDKDARVACECTTTTGIVFVCGEITSNYTPNIDDIVRNTVKEIGYDRGKYGFDAENISVMTSIHKQSPNIAMGVDKGGAGDQGIMFGYASNETPELMPLPIMLAHKLAYRLTQVRKEKILTYLRPDGKTQVTVEYENNKPIRIDTVLLSTQHAESVSQARIALDIKKFVFDEVLPKELIDENTKFIINPTGMFIVGGPKGDSGLTGRKIIVDTYGGASRHGGGAFSGKDPSKVDRSACYAARYIAKNIVAAKLADRCEIQLSYAIGVDKPVSIYLNTFNTNKVSEESIIECIKKNCPLTPKWIIETLDLKRPIYKQTAAYGHFGRELDDFTWERLDLVELFSKLL